MIFFCFLAMIVTFIMVNSKKVYLIKNYSYKSYRKSYTKLRKSLGHQSIFGWPYGLASDLVLPEVAHNLLWPVATTSWVISVHRKRSNGPGIVGVKASQCLVMKQGLDSRMILFSKVKTILANEVIIAGAIAGPAINIWLAR